MKILDHFKIEVLKPSLVIILFLFITFTLHGQNSKDNHPFGGKVVFTLSGGVSVLGVHDYDNIPNYNGNGALEYLFSKTNLSTMGIKLFANKGILSGKYNTYPVPSHPDLYPPEFETEFTSFGGGMTYQYHFSNFFSPYIFGGAAYLYFNPKEKTGDLLPANVDNSYKKKGISYIAELGLRFFVNSSVSINLFGGMNITDSDMLDDVMVGKYEDWIYYANVGVSIALFGRNNDHKYENSNNKNTIKINTTVEKQKVDINNNEVKQKSAIVSLSKRYPSAQFRLSDDGYAIQVLDTTDKIKAENELNWLKKNNYKSFISKFYEKKTHLTKYALRIGYFKTFDETYDYFYGEN